MEADPRSRMCAGKKRYRDETAAVRALHVMEPWAREDGTRLRTYRCDYCDRWHLTSQPPR